MKMRAKISSENETINYSDIFWIYSYIVGNIYSYIVWIYSYILGDNYRLSVFIMIMWILISTNYFLQ